MAIRGHEMTMKSHTKNYDMSNVHVFVGNGMVILWSQLQMVKNVPIKFKMF